MCQQSQRTNDCRLLVWPCPHLLRPSFFFQPRRLTTADAHGYSFFNKKMHVAPCIPLFLRRSLFPLLIWRGRIKARVGTRKKNKREREKSDGTGNELRVGARMLIKKKVCLSFFLLGGLLPCILKDGGQFFAKNTAKKRETNFLGWHIFVLFFLTCLPVGLPFGHALPRANPISKCSGGGGSSLCAVTGRALGSLAVFGPPPFVLFFSDQAGCLSLFFPLCGSWQSMKMRPLCRGWPADPRLGKNQTMSTTTTAYTRRKKKEKNICRPNQSTRIGRVEVLRVRR